MAWRPIDLEQNLWLRCRDLGERIVRGYENGRSERSRAVSTHGAQADPFLQAQARAAECIFALTFGLDPDSVFHDSHLAYDFVIDSIRVDVKRTDTFGRYLIWPIGKNAIFDSKGFDALALVKNDGPTGWVQGFIGKADFARRKTIAVAGHKLDPGTWHVDQSLLGDDPAPAETGRVFCEELRAWL